MKYKTKYVQDLCTTNTEIYEEVLQFAFQENRFWHNVQNLRKSSLEALVYMLLIKQRGKLPATSLDDGKFNLQSIVNLIHLNHLRLQQDNEALRWILSALALMVLSEKDDESVRTQLETIVNAFDRDLHELPIYFDVIRTLLILGKENPQLASICSGLDGERMVKRLASESNVIRMKALACLQTMMEFNAALYSQWLLLLQDPKLMIESRVFILYQLMETLLRLGDRNDDILQTLQTDHVWLICIDGLTTKDPVCRKEALAFVQYALRYVKQCDPKLDGQYFHWSPEKTEAVDITSAWVSFVVIVEALNESQTHLILPALEMIEKVNSLHTVWKNVLLRLILLHENVRVVNHGLYYFLKHTSFDPLEVELEKQFLESFNHCVKACHNVKNVSLRYITFTLLLKSIPQFVEQMKTDDSSPTLLTVVKEVQKLSSIFTMSLEQFQDVVGATFCDYIKTDDVVHCLEDVNVLDTFFIEQLLVRRIANHPDHEREQLLNTLFVKNQPVYLNVLQKLPELQTTRAKSISEIIKTTMRNIMKAEETKQKITPSTFGILAQMIALMRSTSESKCLNAWYKLVEHMRQLASTRLASFDYAQSVAIETIQLTWLLAVCMKDRTLAETFFHSMSLKTLKDSFRRHQTTEPPSIDDVYGMITEIYLCHCQSGRPERSLKTFASEEDWSKLIGLLDVGNIHVLTLVIEILHTETPGPEGDCYDAGRLAVVDRCYKEILNYRKSDHFMKLMEKFIEMLLMPYTRVMDTVDQDAVEIHPRVTEYIGMFLDQANTIYGLANIVFETLFQIPVAIILNWTSFGKLLLQGMIFGEIPKRDQKLECEVVDHCGLTVPFKQHSRYLTQADARVRVLCVQFLYRIVRANHPDAVLFLLKVERMLIERFTQITKAKERYYADSITHRQKLRIVQALCVVLKLTGTKPYPLLDIMLYETNQPNINYLLELIVADGWIDTLTIANLLRNENVKVSGIQSVFVIIWMRCCRTVVLDEQYIYLLLPWTMAQNFSTRLYAQITIKKLLAKFSLIDEGPFKELYAAVNSYLRQGNVERNIEKCMKDFRFNSAFDYSNLLTLENIFHNIPKVSGAPVEDIVGTVILQECSKTLGLDNINLGHALNFNELQLEKHENLFLAQSVGGTEFVQRKIVPLKCLEPNQDLLLGLPQHLCTKKMDSTEGLIVVASLVNRAPNLGGLARTSEIFAVKQLVINSLKDMDDKEFKALSMTAEKWLNVGELKAHKLVEYLEEMKSKGYAIVGAEQTTGSKPIQMLQFPKKCVLVLGHEKNGLPAEVIRHLDLIGEIPQFGVVRSLNVHVTGAIFMWEYVKQHQAASEP
uniref:tRNA/rRNA methyltransferase SpoU type domain-containing protein n=1 Tax=Anopheles culicifacies TaxID=139723 RepID=A0A182MMT1_9DIPT